MLSVQMGYSLVNILDPNTQVESTVVAFFHQSMAMLIFLALDVHHWILRAVAHSFEYLPPGTATLNPMFTRALLHEGAIVLELGIQIAAPVLAATLLVDMVLGLLGKASPQMPLMLLGPRGQKHAGSAAAWQRRFVFGHDCLNDIFRNRSHTPSSCCTWRSEHLWRIKAKQRKRHRKGGRKPASRGRLRAPANYRARWPGAAPSPLVAWQVPDVTRQWRGLLQSSLDLSITRAAHRRRAHPVLDCASESALDCSGPG